MKSLITLIFCFIYISLSAQIIEIPLSDNPVLRQQSRQTDNSDRTIVLDLPFFDDFSYSGPFPDPEKWEDKKVRIFPDKMARERRFLPGQPEQ